MEVILEARDLSFRFNDHRILDRISFECRRGTIYGLFGPNGCGKTTLFNILCGFLKPSSGNISYYGESLQRPTPLSIARHGEGIARSFQIPIVVDDLSVLDNLKVVARLPNEGFTSLLYESRNQREKDREITEMANEYLNRFDLAEKVQHKAGALSYGERRIVSLIGIILTGAHIMLLDEPFANLNVFAIEELRNIFAALTVQQNRTIILIEHRPDNLIDFVNILFRLHGHKLDIHNVAEAGREQLTRMVQSTDFRYE